MDYNLELQNIKDWAKNLLIVQYSQAKKNQALIEVLVDLIFANNLPLKIRDLCLNVDESVGAQLDVVGKWVGIDRYYNGIDLWEQDYTALVNYENISSGTYEQWQGGFSTFENFENHVISVSVTEATFKSAVNNEEGTYVFKYSSSQWTLDSISVTPGNYGISYIGTAAEGDKITVIYKDDIISTKIYSTKTGGFLTWEAWSDTRTKVNAMGDDYFRSLIKLKIIKNSINHTCKNIDDAIWKWSNGQVYTTWDVMEVTYHYPTSLHNLMQLASYKNVLIAPTGCTILTEEE